VCPPSDLWCEIPPFAKIPRSRSFDSAEKRFAQDDTAWAECEVVVRRLENLREDSPHNDA
jgi:hypothetical protein